MAGSVNKVILVGRLGADPEIRRLNSGDPVVNLRVATSESWRDKSTGERKEKAEWHAVVVYNDNLAKLAEAHLRKGSLVYIEGQIQTRKWQDQSGTDRYSTEVVLQKFRGEIQILDTPQAANDEPRQDRQTSQSRGTPYNRDDPRTAGAGNRVSRELDDDPIPFMPEFR